VSEEEWVRHFKDWDRRRFMADYPSEMSGLIAEFNNLEWLTKNFKKDYAHEIVVHGPMSDSYISVCWQACHLGDFALAEIALDRAKWWAPSRIWAGDIPVKIGGTESETERWQAEVPGSELPYVECKWCRKAGFCYKLPRRK